MAFTSPTGSFRTAHVRPGDRTYRLTAPNSATTPRVARELVAAVLDATACPVDADPARLLVSEVVGNVFRHTRAPLVTVEAAVAAASLLVRVTDDDPRRLPVAPAPRSAPCAEHGRGLELVDGLATRWGVAAPAVGRGCPGKTVWFTLGGGGV